MPRGNKTTLEQRIEIKKLYITKKYNQPQLAKLFGVSKVRIGQIINKDWETDPSKKYVKQIRAVKKQIADKSDMREMWMDALVKMDLTPVMRKLTQGITITENERKAVHEGAKVYNQIFSSIDKKDQLKLNINLEINVQLKQVREQVTMNVLNIVEAEVSGEKYARILERLAELEQEVIE